MSRTHPYINKPPASFSASLETLSNTSLLLLSTIGPTVFVIKNPSLSKPFKVYIGTSQRCSCGGGDGRGELCIHILYVMTKVLRVPSDNPVCWQLSLIESEIEMCLRGNFESNASERGARRNPFLRRRNENNRPGSTGSNASNRDRQELVEDEVCPICQDEMTPDDLKNNRLTYCASSCGANIHTRCLKMYGSHALSEKKKILCPLCRSEWGDLPTDNPDDITKNRMSRFTANMPKVKCKQCNTVLKAHFIRCVTCTPIYDVCRSCFNNVSTRNKHDPAHIFVNSDVTQCPPKWSPSVPPIDRTRLFGTLQGRDFTDTDYHTLLSLDGDNVPPIHKHMIQALEKVLLNTVKEEDKCVICSTRLLSDTSLRLLPCAESHIVHESCALSMFIEAQSSDEGSISSVTCCECDDGVPLFPVLVRIPRRTVNKPVTNDGGESGICQEVESNTVGLEGLSLTGSNFNTATTINRPPIHPHDNTNTTTTGRTMLSRGLRNNTPLTQNNVINNDMEIGGIILRSDSAPSSIDISQQSHNNTTNNIITTDNNRGRRNLRGNRQPTIHRSPVTITRGNRASISNTGPGINDDSVTASSFENGGGFGNGGLLTTTSYTGSSTNGGALTRGGGVAHSSRGFTVNEERGSAASRRFKERFDANSAASTGGENMGPVDFSSAIVSAKLPSRNPLAASGGTAIRNGGARGGRVRKGRSGLASTGGAGGVLINSGAYDIPLSGSNASAGAVNNNVGAGGTTVVEEGPGPIRIRMQTPTAF
jgi:E3 ubiquitin-protein ligase ZSWIM2